MTLSDAMRRIRCRTACVLALVIGVPGLTVQAQVPIAGSSRSCAPLAALAGIQQGEPIKCGFPVIAGALHQKENLNPVQARLLSSLLARPILQTSILKNGFRVHFDTSGINAPALLDASHQRIEGTARAYADSVAAIASYVAWFDTTVLAYNPPPDDGTLGGGPEYDIYIANLGTEYGRTTPDVDIPPGGRTSSYLEVDCDFTFVYPDSNRGLPALRVTLAHEFHHAIQIGAYGYWTSDVFFYEITSVWLEEVLFTEVNDYYNYLRSSSGHFRNPSKSFTSGDIVAYSRGIWGIYMEKRFGRDAMRRTWEAIRSMRPIVALENVLTESPFRIGLQAAFTEWTLWNFYTGSRAEPIRYYPEGAAYPEILETPIEYMPPSSTMSQGMVALAARYHQVLVSQGAQDIDTVVLALSNVNVDAAVNGSLATFPYGFVISANQVDPSSQPTRSGVYVKFSVPDPLNWTLWFIEDSTAGLSAGVRTLAEGTAFPNPFSPDGKLNVHIPVDSEIPVTGVLTVYSSNMDLVYNSGTVHSSGSIRQVFSWSGQTETGVLAPTGIYLYVLQVGEGRTIRGKIAVIRR